jgi:hypothetical protein
MKRLLSFSAAFLLLALLIPVSPAHAAGPLDEIKNYSITIDPRKDGTLDIVYHIDWLVLDSTSEGPLTWVKVGIPNPHVDELKAVSSSIKSISTMMDSGSWVRLDLDRAYAKGETVNLIFSIHQSYMYRLDTANNTCSYTFVPGWFDEIAVDGLSIVWNKTDVTFSDSTGEDGGYLTWSKALAPGERFTAIVRYSGSTFNVSETMQAQENPGTVVYTGTVSSSGNSAGGAIAVIFIIIVVAIVIGAAGAGGGRYRGGFWGGGSHGGGHGAGCACACACAGGGRAGCSAKTLYGTAVDTKKLQENLEQR